MSAQYFSNYYTNNASHIPFSAKKRTGLSSLSLKYSRMDPEHDFGIRSHSRPLHKLNCTSDLGEGIQPLIKSFTANPMLSHYLQLCVSLEFDLHRINTRQSAPEKAQSLLRNPLLARIDVGIEPTKITDFMNLYTFGDQWDQDDLEGMLQLHHLTSSRSEIPIESISDTGMSIWKHARETADENGDADRAVVLVQFVNNFKQAITCPIVVGQEALKSARRAKPFTSCSALTGKETDHPLSIASCFE